MAELMESGDDMARFLAMRRLATNVVLDCARTLAKPTLTEAQRAQEHRWIDGESGVKFTFRLAAALIGTDPEQGLEIDIVDALARELKADPAGLVRRYEFQAVSILSKGVRVDDGEGFTLHVDRRQDGLRPAA